MNRNELLEAIQAKSIEIENAIEGGLPHDKLLKIYKELKDLQYQKVQAEMDADINYKKQDASN